MSDIHGRVALTPAEFDARCRLLIRRAPYLSETSGTRSTVHNAAVGGDTNSKHLFGMARDFVSDDGDYSELDELCIALGLRYVIHDKGSGNHLHVQGLPPGPIAEWWLARFG